MADQPGFFRAVHQDESQFDPETFLLHVEEQFSEPVYEEVRWRLQVLSELTARGELAQAASGLRRELSRIFATVGDEQGVLAELKALTEVEGPGGRRVDLRGFLKREKRTLGEVEYRAALARKIRNTAAQVDNLALFFPDARGDLDELVQALRRLAEELRRADVPIQRIRSEEERLRESPTFSLYEELKDEFLRQWLGRFGDKTPEEIASMAPEEIQRLIVEHQRHQMTQLLKSQVSQVNVDMSEHMVPHETLECTFVDRRFWDGAGRAIRDGFREWILEVIQAFGILKGHRYALFQNDKEKNQLLLFGVGVGAVGDSPGGFLEMVPFVKPFTRKGAYLLEIRQRELGDPEQYHNELRHYVLPFLFAFDQMQDFSIRQDLITFFTSRY